MDDRQYQFEWDDVKAAANERKHGVSFELASTVFRDPRLLTLADLAHSEIEERWFSIGRASNGEMLSVAYLWSEHNTRTVEVRLISARQSTRAEIREYEANL